MIQESVNQLFTTAGLAARLSPEVERRKGLKQTQIKENIINEQLKSANLGLRSIEKELGDDPKDITAAANQAQNVSNIYKDQEEMYKKRFDLEPSKETYLNMSQSQGRAQDFSDRAKQFRQLAKQRAGEKITNGLLQVFDFNDVKNQIQGGNQ